MSGRLSRHVAMWVDGLVPARAVAAAYALRGTVAADLRVRHLAGGVEAEGEVQGHRVRIGWDLAPTTLRLRAALAAAPSPDGQAAPLAALLPSSGYLRTDCGCGRPAPCAHALALLLALGACLDGRPDLLFRDGAADAGPAAAAAPAEARPERQETAHAWLDGFWTFEAPARAPTEPEQDRPAPPIERLPPFAEPSLAALGPELCALWRRTREAIREGPRPLPR